MSLRYIYGVLLSHKKNDIAIYSNMDGPRDCDTEWRKSDTERQISYDIAYLWNKKKKQVQMNLFAKQK